MSNLRCILYLCVTPNRIDNKQNEHIYITRHLFSIQWFNSHE